MQFLSTFVQEFHSVLSLRPTVPLLWINGNALFSPGPSAQGGRMKHFTVLDTGPLCFCLQPPYIVLWNALPPPPPPKGCCPQGWPASRPASLSGLSPLSGQKPSSLSRTAGSCSTHPLGSLCADCPVLAAGLHACPPFPPS